MILLHPGYPKTASTWLQKELFLDRHGFEQLNRDNGQRLGSYFVVPPHEYNAPVVHRKVKEKEAQAAENGAVPVVTCEGLAGGFRRFQNGLDAFVIARRLADAFTEAKVLIGIREQVGMIMSLYNQYLRHFGIKPLARYILEYQGKSAEFQSPEDFCYDRLIRCYQDLFGRRNVMVYTLEEFRDHPDAFLEQFKAFIGGRFDCSAINTAAMYNTKSGEYLAYGATRWLGFPRKFISVRHLERHGEQVKKFRRFVAVLYPEVFERLYIEKQRKIVRRCTAGIYAESNAVTAELTGLDLRKYGYEL